jgi:hypothetical protein
MLGALASAVLLFIAGMIIFTLVKAWPSFANNGLAWFGAGGNVDQQLTDIFNSPANPADYVYELRAWPLIWSTILISSLAVVLATFIAVFSSIFIVHFAPGPLQKLIEPIVKYLAAVPSVVYGLIGILVVVPWINNNLITEEMRASVAYVIQLDGSSVLAAVMILTVMILPGPFRSIGVRGRWPWASTSGGPSGPSRSGRSDRPSWPLQCSLRRGRSVRRSCWPWSLARSGSRRTRSMESSFSSNPPGPLPPRSSTVRRAFRSSRSARRCTPSGSS